MIELSITKSFAPTITALSGSRPVLKLSERRRNRVYAYLNDRDYKRLKLRAKRRGVPIARLAAEFIEQGMDRR